MKKYLLIAVVIVLPLLVSAQVKTWKSDPAHSRLGFVVKHLAISEINGYFSDFETTVTYSKADYSDIHVKVVAKISSIHTGIEMRDTHLKSADFFDAEKYPEMVFVSTKAEKVNDKQGKLYGNLTFHGITKPVVLDVTYFGTVTNPMSKAETAGFKITGSVSRKDYDLGMSFADNFISDNVNIIVDTEFSPVK